VSSAQFQNGFPMRIGTPRALGGRATFWPVEVGAVCGAEVLNEPLSVLRKYRAWSWKRSRIQHQVASFARPIVIC